MEDKINVIEKRPELLTSEDLEGKKVSNEFTVGGTALRGLSSPLSCPASWRIPVGLTS